VQQHSTHYPAEQATRLVTPGDLVLTTVRWSRDGAFVTGRVGDDDFEIRVPTADLLNRKSFCFALWRYRGLLAKQPGLEVWQDAIRVAEGGAE
jgi:hypothetical protein